MILLLALSGALFYNVHAQCFSSVDKYIGDLCYSIPSNKLSFSDARNYCNTRNQNLAVLHTTLQANFLASIVRTQTGAPEGKFWIGLSRPTVSSRFTWDDGTTMYWSNFDLNFPKDNLFVAESTVNGKWQTLDGKQSLFFVCSYDPANPVTGATVGTTDTPTNTPTTQDYYWTTSIQPTTDTWGTSEAPTTDYPQSIQPDYSTSPTPTFSASTTPAEYYTTDTPPDSTSSDLSSSSTTWWGLHN